MRRRTPALASLGVALLGACSDHRLSDGNEVDLNAAATMAQQDIANYAAARPPAHRLAAGRFRCTDGGLLTVRLDRRAGIAQAVFDGTILPPLVRRVDPAGVAYEGSGVSLRGSGQALTLVRPGAAPLACAVAG